MSDTEAEFETEQAETDRQIAMECFARRQPIPSDVFQRIRRRAEQARKTHLEMRGSQSSGAEITREIRGELPET